ncbi:MAG TPA: tRNA glutamyl-Q(34) synthetase GluQRS [Thermoanaerobaculia bacterium]|nr:tRNA glutamyl-Q(34) synthetase GluQRS [Thermoanaerobaculia bacterium]
MPVNEPDKPVVTKELHPTGRFAPSPTGPLHLGSLVAAVGSWLFARSVGGTWLVRMEDLDPPRVVRGSADSILRSLERFGLTWDGDLVFQSERTALYEAALLQLRDLERIYDCACSRADLRRAASAPSMNPADMEMAVYPGTCRDGIPAGLTPRALRFQVSDERISFTDMVHGLVEEDLAWQCGDFVVRRADGLFAYQLAVVVDDAEQGVTQVVRGEDLLSSTARQIALQHALGYPTPAYAHLPLLVDGKGGKLGKRTGALAVDSGTTDEIRTTLAVVLRMLGCGDLEVESPEAMLSQALANFTPAQIPRGNIEVPD